jgi:hypothetical protein
MVRGGEAAIVVTETAILTTAVPLSATELGATAQVDSAGPPMQVRATVRLKPPEGETATVKFAVCPAETVVEAGVTGANEKSCPVPLSAAVCGLPGALSLIVNVPDLVPLAVGSKKTPIAQLEPAATVLPQAFSVPKSVALVVTLEMLRVALPLFITVTL